MLKKEVGVYEVLNKELLLRQLVRAKNNLKTDYVTQGSQTQNYARAALSRKISPPAEDSSEKGSEGRIKETQIERC